MAKTPEGAAATEEHRQAQIQIRASALRDFATVWPLWKPDDASTYAHLVAATLPLVRAYNRLSSAVATGYYSRFRAAEGIPGPAPGIVGAAPDDAQITSSLYVTGQVTAERAQRAGRTPAQARQTALVSVSGAVTRHVLAGGRDALLESVAADPEALGWARVTDGNPCYFCALLASRGPVYKDQASAGFQAHDHCACMAEPVYPGADWPGRAREYAALYRAATRDRPTDPRNAFRRAYEKRPPGGAT